MRRFGAGVQPQRGPKRSSSLRSICFADLRRISQPVQRRPGADQFRRRIIRLSIATETCPGHSTILTGGHPSRTGIVANNYFNLDAPRDDKRVYCAEDETVPGTSSRGGQYAPSVAKLLVPTLGDLMKARDPRAQVVSIAGKDRSAIMMGGHKADEVMWLAPGGLATYRGTALSPVAQQASTAIAGAIASARGPLMLPAECARQDIAVALDGGKAASVPDGRRATPGISAFPGIA